VIVDLKRLSYDLDLNSFPTRRSSDLGMTEVEGPFNATANGKISLTELIQLVEKATGKTAKISLVGNDEIRSPYAIPSSWYMSNRRKSTRLNSSHVKISYAVFCLKKKT